MRKTVRIGLISVLAVTLLSGCGADFSADKDTVYVQKKGTIKGANVADFDKEYYDEEELSDFITETVDTYVAGAGEGSVEIVEFAVEDGTARVYLDYAGAEDYAAFNGVEFFAGSVLESFAAGYDLAGHEGQPGDYNGTEDAKKQDATWDDTKNKIVIIGQDTSVQVDGTILFYTPNVTVTGKNTADVAFDILDEDAEPGYIVYK